MNEPLPIPPGIWRRILAFLREGLTGQIVLHVCRGRVRRVEITERITAEET